MLATILTDFASVFLSLTLELKLRTNKLDE